MITQTSKATDIFVKLLADKFHHLLKVQLYI